MENVDQILGDCFKGSNGEGVVDEIDCLPDREMWGRSTFLGGYARMPEDLELLIGWRTSDLNYSHADNVHGGIRAIAGGPRIAASRLPAKTRRGELQKL